MRIQRCCIDTAIVESRCDQRLRRYLLLRDATVLFAGATEAVNVNVVVTGVDCDHFGPLLRAGDIVEADMEIADGCYRLVDRFRRQHAEDRAYAHQHALDAERLRVADARALAQDVLCRALRA